MMLKAEQVGHDKTWTGQPRSADKKRKGDTKMKTWYQTVAGGTLTAMVNIDDSVYESGYTDQQLENMVFSGCTNNHVFETKPEKVDFIANFFINSFGNLDRVVII